MALRYGSKNGSALRYNPYSALALRYGGKNAWSSGGGVDFSNPTPDSYFTFTLLEDDTYSIAAKDVTNLPEIVVLPSTYNGKAVTKVATGGFVNFVAGKYNQTMTTLYIPKSIISIGGSAFTYCINLKRVVIEKGVTSIGDHAFMYCQSLIDINIPNSVTTIDEFAFSECINLTRITIPDSVTFVGLKAFDNCSKLTIYCEALNKPSGWNEGWNSECPVVWGYFEPTDNSYFTFTVQTDGTYSIKAKSTSNLPDYVVIPSTYNGKAVTAIEMLAFNNTAISKLYIPEGITSIGYASFAGCSNLENVYLPASLTSIGEQAFNNCTNLATVTIANNSQLASISDYAFNYCSALVSIIIPASVTTIGAYAFRNCDNLTINCEASSKPSGWDSTWNGSRPVTWGYTG